MRREISNYGTLGAVVQAASYSSSLLHGNVQRIDKSMRLGNAWLVPIIALR